jgi:diguanylate cyclase (GGDEF)-like protein
MIVSGTLGTRTPDHDAVRIVDELNDHARTTVAEDIARALETAQEALARSDEADYALGRAHALRTIGDCRHRLAEQDEARTCLDEAIVVFREQRDQVGEAAALHTLGSVEYSRSDYPAALERFHASLALARAAGARQLESNALNGAATSHYALGDYPRAAELYRDSLRIRRELGDRAAESGTLSNLGLVHQELGDFASAAELHREALAMKRELGDRQGEANVLANLGVDLHRLGEHGEARALHREALTLAREIGNRHTEAGCLENLGLIAETLGELPEAVALFETALGMQRSLGNRLGEASALARTGTVRLRLGDHTGALGNLGAALHIAEEIGARRLDIDTRRAAADVYAALGDLRAALDHTTRAADDERELFREQHERSTAALLAGLEVETAQREAERERARSDELEHTNEALRRIDAERDDLLGRLRAQATELERLSREDLVTGLATRRHFESQLEARFERAAVDCAPLSVAILDVDHFKLVNDIPRSHRVGDAVLREIAAMLRVGVRDTDLVARWGGEEFALLIDDDRDAAAAACERIRAALEAHDWTRLHPSIRVTISVGVAGVGEAASADDLLFVADKRLFEAKDSGRNRVCW